MSDDKDPAAQFALLAHIDRVVENKVNDAIAKWNLEHKHSLDEIHRKLGDIEKLIRSGFPNGDPVGHCRVHEQYIVEAQDRKELKVNTTKKALEYGVVAVIMLIANSIWDFVKGHLK